MTTPPSISRRAFLARGSALGVAAGFALPKIGPFAAPLLIVADGEPRAAIAVRRDAHEHERLAATEIQDYVRKATGATLPIVHTPGAEPAHVFVGSGWEGAPGSDTRVAADVLAPFAEEAFLLRRGENAIHVRGNGPRGTLYAAYELLHRELGVRWLEPGPAGEHVPTRRSLEIEELDLAHVPSFEMRAFRLKTNVWSEEEMIRFALRHRINMTDIGDAGLPRPAVHTYYTYVPPEKYFAEHPEYYPLIDGERRHEHRDRDGRLRETQLETANPEVVRVFAANLAEDLRRNPRPIVGLSPNDGYGWSESPEAIALDRQLEGRTSDHDRPGSDRIFQFTNAVAAQLAEEFPDVTFLTLAYVNYTPPPVSVRPLPNVVPWICQYDEYGCYTHALAEPDCPENSRYRELLKGWLAVSSRVYTYNYSNKWGGWENVMRPVERLMAHDARWQHRQGVSGYESQSSAYPWAITGPTIYATARLTFDASEDPDGVLEEFFRLYYSEVSEPMAAYHRLAQETWESAPIHADANPARDAPLAFPADRRRAMRRLLARAGSAARSGTTRTRVRRQTLVLDYTDLYISLTEAWARYGQSGDPAALQAAGEHLDAILALAERERRSGVFNVDFISRMKWKWADLRKARGDDVPFRVHKVVEGETLEDVAARYGVDLQVIRKENALEGDRLEPNRVLLIVGVEGAEPRD